MNKVREKGKALAGKLPPILADPSHSAVRIHGN